MHYQTRKHAVSNDFELFATYVCLLLLASEPSFQKKAALIFVVSSIHLSRLLFLFLFPPLLLHLEGENAHRLLANGGGMFGGAATTRRKRLRYN